MREKNFYGFYDDEYDDRRWENFKVRARKLSSNRELKLCEWCLKSNRWCYESSSFKKRLRNWKKFRKTQWKNNS